VMAFFNAPEQVLDHENRAVESALLCISRLDKQNEKWQNDLGISRKVKIKIGIHTARCLVGIIGSDDRMSYTALGDGVNLASRLEGLNGKFNTNIIISETTWKEVQEKFLCRWLNY